MDEIGGFCFSDKIEIITNIKEYAESETSLEICNGVILSIYSNDKDIYDISEKDANLTLIDLGDCKNDLINYNNSLWSFIRCLYKENLV